MKVTCPNCLQAFEQSEGHICYGDDEFQQSGYVFMHAVFPLPEFSLPNCRCMIIDLRPKRSYTEIKRRLDILILELKQAHDELLAGPVSISRGREITKMAEEVEALQADLATLVSAALDDTFGSTDPLQELR